MDRMINPRSRFAQFLQERGRLEVRGPLHRDDNTIFREEIYILSLDGQQTGVYSETYDPAGHLLLQTFRGKVPSYSNQEEIELAFEPYSNVRQDKHRSIPFP